jgi:hypothetical protein
MDAGLTSAIGGTSISAGLMDSQAQIDQALGTAGATGSDSVAQFAAAYRASNGGPVLTLFGFNPFQLTATGAFHTLYWGAIVIFLGIMAIISMQHVLNGRYSVRGRHPLTGLVQIYFRLLIGVLLIANLPVVYGAVMTVNRVFSTAVQSISSESLSALLRTGSAGPLTLGQARADAIRQAVARRAVALYPANGSRAELIQIGTWYNALATALNARLSSDQLSGTLPTLDATRWNDSTVPDDQVTAAIGRSVLRNFGLAIADLAALPATEGSLTFDFAGNGSSTLELLSSDLAADDAAAAAALALPATPASSAAFEAARTSYANNVLAHTLDYLDTQILAGLQLSPTLADRAKAWFSDTVDRAGAAVSGTMLAAGRAAIDWLGRSVGVMLTRAVAFLFTAGTSALIELELFVLVLAMPLWLLPATEEAFHGALRTLAALSLAAPAYQFLMLFVDALMGLLLKYLVLGPLAVGPVGAGSAAGGAAYAAVAATALVTSGGEIVGLVLFCYLSAYLFLAIYFAFKTPKLVAAFLKGAGVSAQFLSTFATGVVSGAAAGFATASVAAGPAGLAGRWLASSGTGTASRSFPAVPQVARSSASSVTNSGAAPVSPPPSAAATEARPPSFANASEGKEVERGGSTRFDWAPAAQFGFRTFVDCLSAKSPGDGFATAWDALNGHRKQQEKAAEASFKAEQSAAKAAAKAAPKPAAKRRAK